MILGECEDASREPRGWGPEELQQDGVGGGVLQQDGGGWCSPGEGTLSGAVSSAQTTASPRREEGHCWNREGHVDGKECRAR